MIRKAAGKPLGTIVIPVFIDESEDADHVLSSRSVAGYRLSCCGRQTETDHLTALAVHSRRHVEPSPDSRNWLKSEQSG